MTVAVKDIELVITRTFDAPRSLVFDAWTDAKRLAQWWGPKGSAITVHHLDARPGGTFHYSMQFPDGKQLWGKFVYREIVAPERIVFVNSFSDEAGGITRAPFSPIWPLEVLNNTTFVENDGKTTLTLRGAPINATEEEENMFASWRASMQQGFGGSFDQLAVHLADG